jgi:DNA-directed RNA polymerase sigma subunit (sigma70/sigma32)
LRGDLVPLVPRLQEPWRSIVTLRYGLEGCSPLTMTAIGPKLGLSSNAVARGAQSATRHLRQLRREEATNAKP